MLDARLTRWHAAARRHPALHRLAIVSRILLALAFVPTGLVQLLGWRFTVLDPATPIGGFFEAMYRTGAYWQFLGASQVAAGVLLLIPATATLGALAVLPIMLNITVITWALDFTGTRGLVPGTVAAAGLVGAAVATGMVALAWWQAWRAHRWPGRDVAGAAAPRRAGPADAAPPGR